MNSLMALKGKKHLFKHLDDIIDFGVHKGHTIEEILKIDKEYIIWMHNKTNNKIGKILLKIIKEQYPDIFDELNN